MYRNVLIATFVVGMELAGFLQPALGQDAVAYQINPAHDGHTSFPAGFSAPLKRAWSRNLGGQVSYPIIANGMVFVTVGNTANNPSSELYALDLSTGKIVWQKLIGGPFSWSNATYENGRVFVISYPPRWLDRRLHRQRGHSLYHQQTTLSPYRLAKGRSNRSL